MFCVGMNGESRRGTGVGCKFGWAQEEIHYCIRKRSRLDRFGRCTHRLVQHAWSELHRSRAVASHWQSPPGIRVSRATDHASRSRWRPRR